MSRSAGPVILAGALAASNEALFSPLAAGKAADWGSVWRLVPVTAGLALGLALLEKAAPAFAVGLAWLLVGGVIVFPPGNAPSVLANVNKILHL
ncbi:MAG: hypothetical protein ACRDPY_33605 [Streptosporangiaceae bacterium]